MHTANRLAAVDLGSNSFRLEIGRMDGGVFQRTEYLKETVRQGGGLDDDGNLTPAAMQAGWECLARFGERLQGFHPHEVKAVATQTLREARNRDVFLDKAHTVLGFPIEVISGREEARLIYQGVSHMLPALEERRLVIDIGGRSTELILGHGRTPVRMESFRVGSIAWSQQFFPDGQFTRKAFDRAEVAAKAVLEEALDLYHPALWEAAYGSAGTVGAIGDVLVAAGWAEGLLTQQGLDWLLEQLLAAQNANRLRMAGMREDRRAIIGGGLSVMRAIFGLLQMDTMHKAQGGLRHGLLCDLTGNAQDYGDLRTQSVQRLASKFHVDSTQNARVAKVATFFLQQILHGLDTQSRQRVLRTLEWAAQVHEIGVHIAHDSHHKHGAYILDNTDMPGFSISEMHSLGLLVLGQRGKLRKLESALSQDTFVRKLICLRLAVILCHARRDPDLQGMHLRIDPHDQALHLHCRSDWATTHPQSAHLLREEALLWLKAPRPLHVHGLNA